MTAAEIIARAAERLERVGDADLAAELRAVRLGGRKKTADELGCGPKDHANAKVWCEMDDRIRARLPTDADKAKLHAVEKEVIAEMAKERAVAEIQNDPRAHLPKLISDQTNRLGKVRDLKNHRVRKVLRSWGRVD